MGFDLYVGIDYSGAKTPRSRLMGLQVYAASGRDPEPFPLRSAADDPRKNWNRKEVADLLIGLAENGTYFIAGIDHDFSFPITYFQRYGLTNWDA